MTFKKWLVGAIAAVSITAMAGTSAVALQNGGSGGSGGDGGDSGEISGATVTGGEANTDNSGACDGEGEQPIPALGIQNIGIGNSSASTTCRGFSGRGGNARLTVRTGKGGRGGAGGSGGGAGNRTIIRRAGGGLFEF